MSTSGVYTFSVSRDDIVREALLNLKKIDGIDPIDDTIMSDCTRKLNLLCKQWMGRADFAPGLKVWTRKHGHLFLHSTTGRYSVGPSSTGWTENYVTTVTTADMATNDTTMPVASLSGMTVGDHVAVALDTGDLYWDTIASFGALTVNLTTGVPSPSAGGSVVFSYTTTAQQPLFIESAVLRDYENSDTPLDVMQSRDYDFLPDKVNTTNIGDPGAIYYENQLGDSYLYTDVAGSNDVSKHIAITFMQAVQDFVNSTDTPYYPQEWYRALCWGLTKECCPMFNAAWTPAMDGLQKESLLIAQGKDPEIETRYFQPGSE